MNVDDKKVVPKTKLSELKKISPNSSPSKGKEYDYVNSLPVDDTMLSYKERTIIDSLYPPSEENIPEEKIPEEKIQVQRVVVDDEKGLVEPIMIKEVVKKSLGVRELCLLVVIFVILNLPQFDKTMNGYVENPYYRTMMKAVIFAVIIYVLTTFIL